MQVSKTRAVGKREGRDEVRMLTCLTAASPPMSSQRVAGASTRRPCPRASDGTTRRSAAVT